MRLRSARQIIAGLCLSAALALPAAAQTAGDVQVDESRITDFEYGIFCTERTGEVSEAPSTIEGEIGIIDTARLVSAQTTIPAALGLSFGTRAKSAGPLISGVQFRIQHPPMGDSGTTEQGWLVQYGDAASGTFWKFEQDFEMVPGDWELSATDSNGQLLYRVAFTVVAAEDYTGRVPSCIAELLS